MTLGLDNKAEELLGEPGYDPGYGARDTDFFCWK